MAKESIIFICTHGELWLTMEGDQHDHLLGHGDRHVVAGPGKVIVQALEPIYPYWHQKKFAERNPFPTA